MIAIQKKYVAGTTIIAHHPGYPYMFSKATLIVPRSVLLKIPLAESRMITTNSPITPTNNDEDEEENKSGGLPGAMMTKFLEARTIMIFGGIDQKLAERVSTQLLYLDHVNHDPIRIFLNSPGGHVESGDTIHDLVRYISSPVAMIGTGWVASAGTHIFLGVPKEQRFCLPNTRFLIHQPSGGAGGKASDIAIQAQEIVKMRERLARIIADETGQDVERVRKDIDRDYWMSTEEAKEYGILGTVIDKASEVTI